MLRNDPKTPRYTLVQCAHLFWQLVTPVLTEPETESANKREVSFLLLLIWGSGALSASRSPRDTVLRRAQQAA
jgi:hypothetical protein